MKKGTKFTEEHKRKIGAANSISRFGLKDSEETKLKKRNAQLGKKVPSRGRIRVKSPEEITKLKKSIKERYDRIGRKTQVTKLVRGLFKYRQWRSDVFTRDDYTCQFCGQRGGEINADHIKPLHLILKENKIKTTAEADLCDELWNINNGRTLCVECHRKTDTYARPKHVVIK